MMMDVFGVPLSLIGLILVLDRPLDMVRTCVNVWGDAVGCTVISRSEELARLQLSESYSGSPGSSSTPTAEPAQAIDP